MPELEREIVTTEIAAFLERARYLAAGGLTVAEFGRLAVDLMRLVIGLVDKIAAPGADKKAVVLASVGDLFDAVADKAVPLAAYPLFVLLRPALRALCLAVAAGAVESLLPLVRAI
jgi:hypothetical protein